MSFYVHKTKTNLAWFCCPIKVHNMITNTKEKHQHEQMIQKIIQTYSIKFAIFVWNTRYKMNETQSICKKCNHIYKEKSYKIKYMDNNKNG